MRGRQLFNLDSVIDEQKCFNAENVLSDVAKVNGIVDVEADVLFNMFFPHDITDCREMTAGSPAWMSAELHNQL